MTSGFAGYCGTSHNLLASLSTWICQVARVESWPRTVSTPPLPRRIYDPSQVGLPGSQGIEVPTDQSHTYISAAPCHPQARAESQ